LTAVTGPVLISLGPVRGSRSGGGGGGGGRVKRERPLGPVRGCPPFRTPKQLHLTGVQLWLRRQQRVARTARTAQAGVLCSSTASPTPPPRATGVGRRGGEERCTRRAPQRSPCNGRG
jgi:hypothetical protein